MNRCRQTHVQLSLKMKITLTQLGLRIDGKVIASWNRKKMNECSLHTRVMGHFFTKVEISTADRDLAPMILNINPRI